MSPSCAPAIRPKLENHGGSQLLSCATVALRALRDGSQENVISRLMRLDASLPHLEEGHAGCASAQVLIS
jgi:hypothetical protein